MAADFVWTPHRVEGGIPMYNVVKTDMEGMRTKTRLKSTKPTRTWTLYFRIQTQVEFEAILNHYKSVSGTLQEFHWTGSAIPAHVNPASESYFNVRYNDLSAEPVAWTVWNLTIKFDEAI
jgi:hypothetical protein